MNVIIYTTKTCPWCKKTKEFLNQHNIKYKEIDVGEDKRAAEEMVKKSGHMGTPVIDVDGKIIIGFIGFNEEKLKEALKL